MLTSGFEPEIATGQQSIRKERHVDKSKNHLKSVRMNGHQYPLLTNSSFGAVGILHDKLVPFAMEVPCFERALREAAGTFGGSWRSNELVLSHAYQWHCM